MLKKTKFDITGIHCASCKTLIETELDVLPGVNRVEVNNVSGETEIEFEDEKIDLKKVFKKIEKLGYKIKIDPSTRLRTGGTGSSTDSASSPQTGPGQEKDDGKTPVTFNRYFFYGFAIPIIILVLISSYFLVEAIGGFEIMSKLNDGRVSYLLIFIIGILASFHCVGMCGGLVVAYSAGQLKAEEEKEKKKKIFAPHFQYNFGRFISYTIIGGILGGIGSFFGINPIFTGIITLVAGVFMVLMGLSFLSHGKILEKIKIRTPQFIARFLYNQKHSKNPKGPLIIGLLNGFMPCGPLQAMQLYALASGTMLEGAISMALYALGTVPLMFGFGVALSKISQGHIKKIMKVSGILIIILGLFMANRGLTNFGYGFGITKGNTENVLLDTREAYQEINMDLSYLGYKPNVLYIKEGIPVRWIINVKQMTGCTNSIMIESLGIKKDLSLGENIIEFIPPENVKEIKFSCWMKMVWGKFIITRDGSSPKGSDIEKEANSLPQGSCDGSCGSSSCGVKSGGSCGCSG